MKSEPEHCGYTRCPDAYAGMASAFIAPSRAFPVVQGDAARAAASPTPLWPCLCGARNRLRDTACRLCGALSPDWKDDYDDAKR